MVDRGGKANSHLLQDVLKQSRACPLTDTYTARVVWCGTGHKELKLNQMTAKYEQRVIPR